MVGTTSANYATSFPMVDTDVLDTGVGKHLCGDDVVEEELVVETEDHPVQKMTMAMVHEKRKDPFEETHLQELFRGDWRPDEFSSRLKLLEDIVYQCDWAKKGLGK